MRPPVSRVGKGQLVAKDKKKKKNKKVKAVKSLGSGASKAAKSLKSLAGNALVADVVAAALVATAAALRNPKKARQLAEQAGDQLADLGKEGADRGNAMWQLALEVGRQTLETLAGEHGGRGKSGAGSGRKAK
jgi:hypothetical protein